MGSAVGSPLRVLTSVTTRPVASHTRRRSGWRGCHRRLRPRPEEASGQVLSISGGNSVTLQVVAAGNGLNVTSGGTVQLGGPLTQATTLTQAGNFLAFNGGQVGVGTGSLGSCFTSTRRRARRSVP